LYACLSVPVGPELINFEELVSIHNRRVRDQRTAHAAFFGAANLSGSTTCWEPNLMLEMGQSEDRFCPWSTCCIVVWVWSSGLSWGRKVHSSLPY